MTELASQQDYWNKQAKVWEAYDAPLVPGEQDLSFHQKHLKALGNTLILGATPELCELARGISETVISVDFAEDVIDALQIDGVQYECAEWGEYFEKSPQNFDNILTDGGMVCLEFPHRWESMAHAIATHLLPSGVFSARVYLSTNEPPLSNYENPNLGRFVSSLANVDANWMLRPGHPDYAGYDVRYAFPTEEEVLRTFGNLALIDTLVPDYQEGGRFVSYAWQLS